jgi:hypothetical protein
VIKSIPPWHPYWHIRSFVEELQSEIQTLYFSYYEYIPQSIIDNRKIFGLSTSEFLDKNTIEAIIQSTPPSQELAFHSKVDVRHGESKHIPMVDMSTGSEAQLAKLKPFLGEDLFKRFKWYKSGRSFHGYGRLLVMSNEWAALLGMLLLANQKGFAPTVDPRWVGHRLIAGYASLRWTKNTPHYINLPREII